MGARAVTEEGQQEAKGMRQRVTGSHGSGVGDRDIGDRDRGRGQGQGEPCAIELVMDNTMQAQFSSGNRGCLGLARQGADRGQGIEIEVRGRVSRVPLSLRWVTRCSPVH